MKNFSESEIANLRRNLPIKRREFESPKRYQNFNIFALALVDFILAQSEQVTMGIESLPNAPLKQIL